MNRFLFSPNPRKKSCSWHDLRGQDVAVIVAAIFVVGMPLSVVLSYVVDASGHVFPALSSRFAVSADLLTGGAMIVFCLVLGLGMLVGNRFLRQFLSQ